MKNDTSCIYSRITQKCVSQTANEHLIQECIGGTLKSKNIICEACNRFFGSKIDKAIKDMYLKIILEIAFLLPNKIRKTTVPLKAKYGLLIELSAGNTIDIRSGRFIAEKSAFVSPKKFGIRKAKKILKIKSPSPNKVTSIEMPISDFIGEIPYPKKDYWLAYRAAVKSSLNLIRYFELNDQLPKGVSVNWSMLGTALRFVYEDLDSFAFGYNRVPFIDVSEETKKYRGHKHFGHHIIVCNYGGDLNEAFVFISLFNSLSWFFSVPNMFSTDKEFTIMYQKTFLPKRITRIKVWKKAIINRKAIDRNKLISKSGDGIRFAIKLFEEAIEHEHSKLIYYSDINVNEYVAKTIKTMALRHKYESNKYWKAVVDVLTVRYSGHPEINEITKNVSASEPRRVVTLRGALKCYRSLLRKTKRVFGFPVLKSTLT